MQYRMVAEEERLSDECEDSGLVWNDVAHRPETAVALQHKTRATSNAVQLLPQQMTASESSCKEQCRFGNGGG